LFDDYFKVQRYDFFLTYKEKLSVGRKWDTDIGDKKKKTNVNLGL